MLDVESTCSQMLLLRHKQKLAAPALHWLLALLHQRTLRLLLKKARSEKQTVSSQAIKHPLGISWPSSPEKPAEAPNSSCSLTAICSKNSCMRRLRDPTRVTSAEQHLRCHIGSMKHQDGSTSIPKRCFRLGQRLFVEMPQKIDHLRRIKSSRPEAAPKSKR